MSLGDLEESDAGEAQCKCEHEPCSLQDCDSYEFRQSIIVLGSV